jgi:hypothetical protein
VVLLPRTKLMHDWLRVALDKVPLLHGGVRSVVERCPTAGDAFWLYDLPELVAWVALARATERGVPLTYAQALAAELSRAALAEPASTDALDRASTYWRRSAAFSALAALGEHADAFEPFDARRIARAQEHVFLALQIGESLQGVHFAVAEPTPLASEQSNALREALEGIVGDWAPKPSDFELRRRHARATADATRRQFGLVRGAIDPDEHDTLPLKRWTDVLAVAGVVEAPDLAVEDLLPQMESPRDLLLVRCSDLAAHGHIRDIVVMCEALSGVLHEGLSEALDDARASLDRLASDEGLRALPASARRWNRAAAASALQSSLAQAAAIERGPLGASRVLSLVRWSADLGERIETWCQAEQDDQALSRARNVIRTAVDTRDTIRPEDL